MGTLTNLNAGGLPPELATDSEVAAAIAAAIATHLPDNPHPQYQKARQLAHLYYGIKGVSPGSEGVYNTSPAIPGLVETGSFDYNNWTPNANQEQKSAVCLTLVSFLLGQVLNAPANTTCLLIQIDSMIGSQFEGSYLTQFAFQISGAHLYTRNFNGSWSVWQRFASSGEQNDFSGLNAFNGGIRIGASPSNTAPTVLRKLLSQVFTIDPPLLVSGQLQHPGIPLTINGAALGDLIYISPIGADIIFTGIWPFEFRGAVTAANTITVYSLNDWTGGNIDLSPFQIRVVVMGF